ncbi:NEW3 domain-containing protein [Chloroflexota bacterium]
MKASKKVLWLSLLIAVLIVLIVPPAVLLAQEAKIDLSLRMLLGYYYKEVTPGEGNTLYMEIRNNGDKEITNIRFNSDKPQGWVVDFDPGSISYLSAGSSQTIDVNVIPSLDTGRGEYNLTFFAEASETRAVTSTTIRIESGYSLWLWIGIGLTVLVIAGFVIIFLHFGRQETSPELS